MRTIVVSAPRDEAQRQKAVHKLASDIERTFAKDDAMELECRGAHSLRNAVEAVTEASGRNELAYPVTLGLRDVELPGGVVKTVHVLTVHR